MKSRCLVMLLLLASGVYLHATEKTNLKNYEVWGRKDNEIVIMPHVSPLLGVRQISGPPIQEKGSLDCEFEQESEKTPAGDTVKIMAGHCTGGVVVHLVSIDLNH